MTNNEQNETKGEDCGCDAATDCAGCTMTISRNGGAPIDAVGLTTAEIRVSQAQDPTKPLAKITFTADLSGGECNPAQNCAPRLPCKIKDPTLIVETEPGVAGTVHVSLSQPPLSPPRILRLVSPGSSETIKLKFTGGQGTGTPDDPHVIDMTCGAAPLDVNIRFESFDPSVMEGNGQDFKLQLVCTPCREV